MSFDQIERRVSRLSEREAGELAALHAKVATRDADGRYPHWNRAERDRWRELARKQDPAIRFAPSTEETARRFGHLSAREDAQPDRA